MSAWRTISILVLLLCLSNIGIPTVSAQTRPVGLPEPVVPEGFGINIHFTDPQPGEMERFHEAGFAIARMDLIWEAIEKERGKYDFSAYDRLTQSLHKAGVRPLFILDYGNDLYEKDAPRSAEARAAFARFAAAAAIHFKGQDVIFEIWNEPNGGFWKPKANANEYTALALETAKVVKAADPKATLLAPGAAGFPLDFIETLFQSGILAYLDGVSVHPYRGNEPESAAADFLRLRTLIARYAPKEKRQMPIISSEWGYSTVEGGSIDETKQAQYITRMWLANLVSGVNLSIFYDWKEDGTDPKENEHHFGTVKPDLTPKPAFLAAQKLIGDLRGYHFRHRLNVANATDWKLLFQKGDTDEIALVTWSTAPNVSSTEQVPAVHRVTAAEKDYRDLLRLASVRFPYGVLAEATGQPPIFPVTFHNPEKERTLIHLQLFDDAAQHKLMTDVSANVKPGSSFTLDSPWSMSSARVQRTDPIPFEVKWGDDILPVQPYPLTVIRTDVLQISTVPSQTDLTVFIENPAEIGFDGFAVLRQGTEIKARRELKIASGHPTAQVALPSPGSTLFSVELQDKKGETVSLTPPRRFAPLSGFPEKPTTDSGFSLALFIENNLQKPSPLTVIPASDHSPAESVLRFDYHFTPGWRYCELVPDKPLLIPEKATALTLWILGNAPGDALRSRIKDATGQTFQLDLGDLNWKGWKNVTIPLDGNRVAISWGGANDGKLHLPLTWDGILLVDSSNREKGNDSVLLIGAPQYLLK